MLPLWNGRVLTAVNGGTYEELKRCQRDLDIRTKRSKLPFDMRKLKAGRSSPSAEVRMLGGDCCAPCIHLMDAKFQFGLHREARKTTPKLFGVPSIVVTTATRKMKMKAYSFTIIASGLDPNTSNFEDRFFEAGCDDATITFQKGAIILEFEREAKNLAHALDSAIRDVDAAGARVEHLEPDHLVNLSDIAVRAGVTRAAASNYAKGLRGNDFPAPVARVTTDSALWDWVEVARWLFRHRRLALQDVLRARLVRQINVGISRREEPKPRVFGRSRRSNLAVIHDHH